MARVIDYIETDRPMTITQQGLEEARSIVRDHIFLDDEEKVIVPIGLLSSLVVAAANGKMMLSDFNSVMQRLDALIITPRSPGDTILDRLNQLAKQEDYDD